MINSHQVKARKTALESTASRISVLFLRAFW
jgi:hypothetical protein